MNLAPSYREHIAYVLTHETTILLCLIALADSKFTDRP